MAGVETHWSADIDDMMEGAYTWQPVLWETESGVCLTSAQTWFPTEAACVEWIEKYMVGATRDPEGGA